MRIFIAGVSCVGKTTIGEKIAERLGITFFDLDEEIETFFNTSIERLQEKFLMSHDFRNEAAKALVNMLNRPDSERCVVALPPSGLMGGYLRAIKKVKRIVLVLTDTPENIVERIRFYDVDSRPIEKILTPEEKKLYLKEIKKDISYFRTSYQRADLQVDIAGFDANQAADKAVQALGEVYAVRAKGIS